MITLDEFPWHLKCDCPCDYLIYFFFLSLSVISGRCRSAHMGSSICLDPSLIQFMIMFKLAHFTASHADVLKVMFTLYRRAFAQQSDSFYDLVQVTANGGLSCLLLLWTIFKVDPRRTVKGCLHVFVFPACSRQAFQHA